MTTQHAPHTPLWRRVISLPHTRLGWLAVGLAKPRPGRRYTYPLPEWQKNARNPTRFGTSEETSAGRNAAKPRHEGLNLYAVL
jgi:hypothetical protein